MAPEWGDFMTYSHVSNFIKGISFPCSKQDLIDDAEENDAPDSILNMLEKLPERQYESVNDVIESVGRAVI